MTTNEPLNTLGAPRRGGGEDAAEERMEDWFGEDVTNEFEEGEVVRGRVVHVGSGEVLVDVGYKSDGRVPIENPTAWQAPLSRLRDRSLPGGEGRRGRSSSSKDKATRSGRGRRHPASTRGAIGRVDHSGW